MTQANAPKEKKPRQRRKPAETQETALAVPQMGYLAIDLESQDQEALAEAITENLGDEGISVSDLERFKLVSGGVRQWVSGLTGDMMESIQGIILYFTRPRAYWSQSIDDSGGAAPPDCSSTDGKIGVGFPGGDCALCPLNVFGSHRNGRGKACQEKELLYVLPKDRLLPFIIQAPATSLRSMHGYKVSLINNEAPRPYWKVETEFPLERVDAEPFPYSRIIPMMVAPVSPEHVPILKAYRDAIVPKLRQYVAQNPEEIFNEFNEEDRPPETAPDPETPADPADPFDGVEPPGDESAS